MACPPPQSQSTTILLVEDDDLLLDLMTEVLEAEGFRVLAAADPIEALRQAQQCTEPIGLLIADVVMPGMTGMDLAKRVRASRPRIRALLISGYPRDFISRKGVPDPEDEFLWKPFTIDALVSTSRRILEIP